LDIRHSVSGAVVDMLVQLQKGPEVKLRKKRINVAPGKSISLADFNAPKRGGANKNCGNMAALKDEDSANNVDLVSGKSFNEDDEDEALNVSDDDDEMPILPLFPVPADRGRTPKRYSGRICRPTMYSDFVI
jgi:hypothetical protein